MGRGDLGIFGVFPIVGYPHGLAVGPFKRLELLRHLVEMTGMVFLIIGPGGFFTHHLLADALGAADDRKALHLLVEAQLNGLPHDTQGGRIQEGREQNIDIRIDLLQEGDEILGGLRGPDALGLTAGGHDPFPEFLLQRMAPGIVGHHQGPFFAQVFEGPFPAGHGLHQGVGMNTDIIGNGGLTGQGRGHGPAAEIRDLVLLGNGEAGHLDARSGWSP